MKKRDQSQFSKDMTRYVNHVVAAHTAARDGRWLAERTDRGKDYWAGVLNGDALNTNDIQILANLFGVNVYEFVRQARDHARDLETPPLSVRDLDDDFEISDDPGVYGLAALKPRKPSPRK